MEVGLLSSPLHGNFGMALVQIRSESPTAVLQPRYSACTMITRTGTRTAIRPATCLLCQWRPFNVSCRRLADKPPAPTPGTAPNSKTTPGPSPVKAGSGDAGAAEGPLAHAPRSYGKKLTEFTPTPLSRPIGLNYPPSAGENTGVDKRTLKERHADFTNYEKHLKRREELYDPPPYPLSPNLSHLVCC
jgi:ATPase complex subunit ATP10